MKNGIKIDRVTVKTDDGNFYETTPALARQVYGITGPLSVFTRPDGWAIAAPSRVPGAAEHVKGLWSPWARTELIEGDPLEQYGEPSTYQEPTKKIYISCDCGQAESGTPHSCDCWICVCKNQTHLDGFYPCDESGQQMEPTVESNWAGLYVCASCGLIYADDGELKTRAPWQ